MAQLRLAIFTGTLSLAMLGATPRTPKPPAPAAKAPVVPAAPVNLAATRPVPVAVPDSPAIAAVRKTVQTWDLPADGPVRAQEMIRIAMDTTDNPAARYVLLRDARDIACAAGDAATVVKATDRLIDLYTIPDPHRFRLEAFKAVLETAHGPGPLDALAGAALRSVDCAVMAERFVIAQELAALARTAAERRANAHMLKRSGERLKEVMEDLVPENDAAGVARTRLQKDATDPQGNLKLGKYVCLVLGDFERGRSNLARSGDAELARAAEADLANPSDPARQVEAGSLWWDLSERYTSLRQRNLRARAAYWYRRALPRLGGFDLKTAGDRLARMTNDEIQDLNLEKGLLAEVFKGPERTNLVRTRVDAQLNFDWNDTPPDEALTRDNFSFRWNGYLRAPTAGKYTLVLIVNQGARLIIDDRLVLEDDDMTRSRSGVQVPLLLSEGLHSVRLEYWDRGGTSKCQVRWTTPTSPQEAPIPPDAFYHDTSSPVATAGGR